jgi:RNA polymerase sigma factor (sigma-70 family)
MNTGVTAVREGKAMDLFTDDIAERQEQARRFREKNAGLWELVCQRIGTVVSILKNKSGLYNIDWDDWTQETAKRLWTTRARYNPEKAALASWIWVVGKNVALDMIKSKAVRSQSMETKHDQQWLAHPSACDREEKPSSQAVQDVREVVTELAPRERRIIEHTGAAKDLESEIGLSAGAIRVYKHRILAKLRTKLQQRGYS